MKLNLLWNQPNDLLNGYTNLEVTKLLPVGKLDDYVDDGEASEIVALDVIERFSLKEVAPILQHWLKKLKYGGRLIVGFHDFSEIAHSFIYDNIDDEQLNTILFGGQDDFFHYRRSVMTFRYLDKLLKTSETKIVGKSISPFREPLLLGAFACSITVERINAV